MPPKNASSSKQAKKSNKKALGTSSEFAGSEFDVSSASSGKLYKEMTMGKAGQKGEVANKEKGRKVVPQKESPLQGLKRKNPTASPPHTPQPSDVDDDAESSSEEASSEGIQSSDEVEATQ